MAITRTQKLTDEDIQKLLLLYAGNRDIEVRGEIVLQYTNLVESIARRFTGAGEPVEDLVQEGYIGLITAVDLYNASKGVKFSTYATHFVIGQIKHYLRDKGKIIKEPAWLQELNQRMGRVIESLSHKLGRQPTEHEIAEVMQLDEDTVAEMLTTREVFKVSSLDADRDRDDSSSPLDTEKIGQKYLTFQLPPEDKIVLKEAMDRLKEIEQTVIHHFYYLDLNQTEIAKKLGISCNYVSHILRNSTKKLKKILMTEELKDTQIQLQQMERRLQQSQPTEAMTVIDKTTGLYNSRYFIDRLDEEISRASRYGHTVGMVMIKVDFGSSMKESGMCVRTDDIVIKLADTIRSTARKVDVLARLEDDIFCLILPHTGPQSELVAKRMVDKLDAVKSDYAQSRPNFTLSSSAAWGAYPMNAETATDLVEHVSAQLNVHVDHPEKLPRAA